MIMAIWIGARRSVVDRFLHTEEVTGSSPVAPIRRVINMVYSERSRGAEEQKKKVETLLKQIDEFEKTIRGLEGNVASLKKKLQENKEKYGPDIDKWPKET